MPGYPIYTRVRFLIENTATKNLFLIQNDMGNHDWTTVGRSFRPGEPVRNLYSIAGDELELEMLVEFRIGGVIDQFVTFDQENIHARHVIVYGAKVIDNELTPRDKSRRMCSFTRESVFDYPLTALTEWILQRYYGIRPRTNGEPKGHGEHYMLSGQPWSMARQPVTHRQ
jgi:hypothetical protein